MGKDGGGIEERRFSCVANAHVLLNCSFPYEYVYTEAFEQKKEREAKVYMHSH